MQACIRTSSALLLGHQLVQAEVDELDVRLSRHQRSEHHIGGGEVAEDYAGALRVQVGQSARELGAPPVARACHRLPSALGSGTMTCRMHAIIMRDRAAHT